MRRIIYLFILALAITAQNGFAQQGSSSPRTLYVTVESSKTGFIGGLKAGDFKVFEDKTEQPIDAFKEGGPASIGFLFDVSPSVSHISTRDVNDIAAAIHEAVSNNSGKNEYFLIGFNRRTALLADWTPDAENISKGLNSLPSIQNKNSTFTSLYDAFSMAAEKLAEAKNEKKVLIMFTDGIDSSSLSKRKENMEKAFTGDILIYSVTLTRPTPTGPGGIQETYGGTILDMEAEEFLDEITGMTGGTRYKIPTSVPQNGEKRSEGRPGPRGAFGKIFAELRSQYSIRYFPGTTGKPDRTRVVNVKVLPSEDIKKGSGAISLRFRKKYKVPE
jgi:VWFA-related protein